MSSGSFNPIGFLARINKKFLEAFAAKHDIPFSANPQEKQGGLAERFYRLFESLDDNKKELVWSDICDVSDVTLRRET